MQFLKEPLGIESIASGSLTFTKFVWERLKYDFGA